MTHRNDDWYEHLVEQSRTDHIYSLIHGYPLHEWAPNHDYDFVAVRLRNLPPKLGSSIPESDISKELPRPEWCFPGDDYVLLDSERLTEYLEAARRFTLMEDFEDREFIELLFTDDPREYEPDDYEEDEENTYQAPDYRTVTPETLEDREDALGIAYELLRMAKERELAYEYAKIGEQFLDEKRVKIGDNVATDLYELKRLQYGYNIVAMVYAWNNKINDAARVDGHYLLYPNIWNDLQPQIRPYLEMLMAKQQADYLGFIFRDKLFKERFLAHYEAYVSLFIDDQYPLTRMQEFVGIINRINNAHRAYI